MLSDQKVLNTWVSRSIIVSNSTVIKRVIMTQQVDSICTEMEVGRLWCLKTCT